uniref:Maternal effect embryo arrest 60 n=1 Tax=Davidia involucrata TaxID=16924 RepID=A0A5B7C5N8_DAVIN
MLFQSQSHSHHRPMNNNSVPRRKVTTTSIHIMALDGIVNVNSLFTFAVFLGLAWSPTDPNYSLIDTTTPTTCAASSAVAEGLIAFHVYSFSSFLFSSLVASALKQAITTAKEGDDTAVVRSVPTTAAHVNIKLLRAGILASAAGSASGCVFLMLALIDLVQIKLGTLACWSWYSLAAVGPLVILVPSALVIYICIVLHAFTR